MLRQAEAVKYPTNPHKPMNLVKAAIVGLVASLLMFLLIQMSIHSRFSGLMALHAAFNTPPSAAFLLSLGLPAKPLALILHFLYGAAGSIILVTIYKNRVNTVRGIGFGMILWLIMMLVYSPIIGWGFFGFGDSVASLPSDEPLALGAPLKYIMVTLFVHLIYGIVIGWTNKRWLVFDNGTSKN